MRFHEYILAALTATAALYVINIVIRPEWPSKAKTLLKFVVPIAVFLSFGLIYMTTSKKPDDIFYEFVFCAFHPFPACPKPNLEQETKGDEARKLAEQKAQEDALKLAEQKAKEEEARRLAQQKAREDEARRLSQQKAKEEEARRLAEQRPSGPRTKLSPANLTDPRLASEVARLRRLIQPAEFAAPHEAVFESCQTCGPVIVRCRQAINAEAGVGQQTVGFSVSQHPNLRDFLDRKGMTSVPYRQLGPVFADLKVGLIGCVAEGGEQLR